MAVTNLKWPVKTDQARITSAYNPLTGGLKIYAPPGTPVLASSSGTVYGVGSDWVQIGSEQFSITYLGLRSIKVQIGQSVLSGATIAEAGVGDSITLMVYQTFDPTPLLQKPVPAPPPTQPQPTPPSSQKTYLRSASTGVRVREKPVDGKPIAQLKEDEVVESLESGAVTKQKVGVEGQWLQIRRANGETGYVAAWFVALTDTPPATPPISISGSLTGMNLDINHPLGHPSPDQLKGIGWIRIKFNMSLNPNKPDGDPSRYGNTDINAPFNRYKPFIEQYARVGIKTLMVFTHQLYGEGAGFDWRQMDEGKWKQLIQKYAFYSREVAQRFANTGLIQAYQIWNEQDTREGRAAVHVPPAIYGLMMTETIRAIRSVDKQTPIISGGHTTGPTDGSIYARAALNAMPPDVRPDGIASHPYGRGVAGHRFSNWGPLEEEVRKYSAVMPGKPVWFTEWGVLDQQGRADVIPTVTDYANGFMNLVKIQYAGQVAAAMWYAWADSMDNGFGIVDSSGKPKSGLYEKFKTLG